MADLNLVLYTRLYQHFSGAAMFSIEWVSDLNPHILDINQVGKTTLLASDWGIAFPFSTPNIEGATSALSSNQQNMVALAALDAILRVSKHLPAAASLDVYFQNDVVLLNLLSGADGGIFNNVRFLPSQELNFANWSEISQQRSRIQSKTEEEFINVIYEQPKHLLAGRSLNKVLCNGHHIKRNPKLTTVHIGTDGSYHRRYGGATAAWLDNASMYGFFQLPKLPVRDDNSTYAELYAITKALNAHQGKSVRIYTDSKNSLDYIRTGSAPRRMQSMVTEIRSLLEANKRLVQFQWVKSHAGHALNEGADRLARTLRLSNPGPGEQRAGISQSTQEMLRNIMRDSRKQWKKQYNEKTPVQVELLDNQKTLFITPILPA